MCFCRLSYLEDMGAYISFVAVFLSYIFGSNVATRD